MILSFKHRGLKKLYENDDARKLPADYLSKIKRVLARLDIAVHPDDLELPGYRFHALKGNLEGIWSITVSKNWRIIFRMENGHVQDVDFVDYH